jgi:DNA-binding FadR family transcriptional regulator
MSDKSPPALSTGLTSEVRLIASVVELGFERGDVLPSEGELASATHSGRPSLREALSVLEAFGVVRSRQGARRQWVGFDARTFGEYLAATLAATPGAVDELFSIRHSFEATHLPRVMSLMDDGQRTALRRVVDQMSAAARRGEHLDELDEEFHTLLFSRVGNRIFEGLSIAFWRLQSDVPSRRAEDLPSVAAMHARILEAASGNDVRLAVHELDAHFFGIEQRLRNR